MPVMNDNADLNEVRIQTYEGHSQCDVIVICRGRELVHQLPDYNRAVKWARMEAKAYKLLEKFLDPRS